MIHERWNVKVVIHNRILFDLIRVLAVGRYGIMQALRLRDEQHFPDRKAGGHYWNILPVVVAGDQHRFHTGKHNQMRLTHFATTTPPMNHDSTKKLSTNLTLFT
ncbi:hypothetical protein Pelo_5653 [Pelomyxa schiedti]|nr:hypothetical protein Pelo_5653 [Pelomyxa schiedti]